MRADRLLSILLLLQVNRKMTAHELAGRLEVSPRTIHRDMESLSAAGVPVYAERGFDGGWSLMEEYRTDTPGLNEEEIQALFLARPRHLLEDLQLNTAAEAGLIKVLTALPSVAQRAAEFTRERIHIDSAGWNPSDEQVPMLPRLQSAIWRERKVRMSYQRSDRDVERVVDPLGLVAKGSVWYLVAGIDGSQRTYRVSKVKAAEILDIPSQRPRGFDLAAWWEQSRVEFVANLPQYPALLRVRPEAQQWISQMWRFARVESTSEQDAAGWLTLHIMFETAEDACGLVLSVGALAEVVAPRELRDLVAERARQIVAVYQNP
jgi:predicted DNA-binding transcriptional regulator YafY